MREKGLITQNGTTPVLQYNFSYSQKCRWGVSPSGMWCCVISCVVPDIL